MLGHLENVDAEEAVGFRLLEYYISVYLYDRPNHLGIREKKALRLCCKKFKALFDAAITRYENRGHGVTSFSSDNNFFRFSEQCGYGDPEEERKSKVFSSLDLICQTFPSIKDIIVSDSTLLNDALPESIGQLTSLTKLEMLPILWGGFAALPSSFSQLTALKELVMKPSTVEAIAPLEHCTALESLTLQLPRTTSIHEVPEVIGTFTSLTFLKILSRDGACSLPDSIGNLNQLKALNICLNIKNLPESLEFMCSLTSLNVGLTGLKRFPESFGNLTALGELVLNDCDDLEAIPESLGNLKMLEDLLISSGIRLLELPSSISSLQSLKTIKFLTCSFTALPDSIGDLNSLKELRLQMCNRLTTLPESITTLTSLEKLAIEHCDQLVKPTVETLLQRFGKALNYWKGDFRLEDGVRIRE